MDPRDPIVTLNVKNSAGGTDGLYVHQGVLCKSSKFFQTAMKKEWAGLKDEPHVIDLPEDCTETVKMYIEWLYTGKISSKLCMTMEECNFDDKNFSREAEKNFIVLAKAHIYGKKIIDSVFTRQMFNEMRETLFCYMRWPTAECVSVIYEKNPFQFSTSAHYCFKTCISPGGEGRTGCWPSRCS